MELITYESRQRLRHLVDTLCEKIPKDIHVQSLSDDFKEMLEYNLRVIKALSDTDIVDIRFSDAIFGVLDRLTYIKRRVQFTQIVEMVDDIQDVLMDVIVNETELYRIYTLKRINSDTINCAYRGEKSDLLNEIRRRISGIHCTTHAKIAAAYYNQNA